MTFRARGKERKTSMAKSVKRLLRVAPVALAAVAFASSATAASGNGFKLGVNLSRFEGDGGPGDSRNRIGHVLGFTLGSSRAMEMEFLFSQKGMFDKATDDMYEFDYTQVSFLMRYGHRLQWFGGIYLAHIERAQLINEPMGIFMDYLDAGVVKDMDQGFVVGLALSSWPSSLEIRYERGADSVFSSGAAPDMRNETISIIFATTF